MPPLPQPQPEPEPEPDAHFQPPKHYSVQVRIKKRTTTKTYHPLSSNRCVSMT